MLNVLGRIAKKLQGQGNLLLRAIPYAEKEAEALRLRGKFQAWCRKHALHDAAELIERDWERMVSFYGFPKEHWKHLRTSNLVESPFAALRLRTDAAKRFRKVENATAAIFKLLLVAEKRFRRLGAPEKMREVFLGAQFVDGQRLSSTNREAAA